MSKRYLILWRIRVIMLQLIRIFQTENLGQRVTQLSKFSVIFLVFALLPFVSAAANITTCGTTISSPGQYELNQSLNGTTTCLTVTSNDVEINCLGNAISYGSNGANGAIGINAILGLIPKTNLTVKNCIIQDVNASGTTGYGIMLTRFSDSYIFNNTILTNGTATNHGMYLTTSSNNNLIENNTINALGSTTGNYGIYLLSASDNNVIRGNTITATGTTTSYSLLISTGSDSNIVQNNSFSTFSTAATGNTDGNTVYISGSVNNSISENYIYGSSRARNYLVYLVNVADNNTITNNNIINNGSEGTNYGVYAIYSSSNLIQGNTIHVNGTTAIYGVYISSASHNDLINNTLLPIGTSTIGVYALSSEKIRIENNSVIGGGKGATNYGVLLSSSSLINITGNTINVTGTTPDYGIYLLSSYSNNIENNALDVYGTTALNGVYLSSSYLNTLKRNTISVPGTGATNYGMYLLSSYLNTIDSNTVNVSGTTPLYGAYLLYSQENILNRNNITSFGTTANSPMTLGISANYNTIANNTLMSRGSTTLNYGTYLTQAIGNVIENNNITTNGTTTNYGIYLLTNTKNNIIKNNLISTYGTTTNYGMFLSAASDNWIIGNNITTNGTTKSGTTNNWGIHLAVNSKKNEIHNNTVYTDGGGLNYGISLITNSRNNNYFGNKVYPGGNGTTNIGAYVSESHYNIFQDNIFSNSGTATDYGFYFLSSSKNNLAKNNNISTSGGTDSHAFHFLFVTPGYPESNNISNNQLLSIAGRDLNYGTASVNGTWLIDQAIGNYSFTGTGGTLNVKNTSAGEIRFLSLLSGTNTTFSNRISITNNFARIDEYTSLLNKSAEITIYNLPTASTELQIIRNSAVCPSSICTNLTSMQAGNVTFNVTSGGNYSINSSSAIPAVTLNLPANNFNASYKDISFNFTASDDVSVNLSCSLYIDSSLNQTNASVVSGALTNFLVQSLAEGNRSWYVNCFDESNNSGVSETRNFSMVYTIPTISLNYPNNNSYLNDISSVQLNYTVYDSGLNNMTVWLYGNESLLSASYNITNSTTLTYNWTGLNLGQYNWTVISNNGLKNSSKEYRYFSIINLTINCEAGGPYQERALVLAQGNVSNGTSALSSQLVTVGIYKEAILNTSKNLTSLSDGSFQTTFSGLGVGNYVLNASTSYQGNNKSCTDSFAVGGSASFVLDKITSFHNVTNETISYNLTLRLTNSGGGAATSSNITDIDSSESPYNIGAINGGESISRSYTKTYTRNSTTYYSALSIAQSQGINSYSNSMIEANSTQINLTIPPTATEQQLTLIKNAYFNSENSTAVNYTLSAEVLNSGGIDLTGITLLDSDLNLNSLISLNRTQSYNSSSSLIVQKAASNTEKLFVKSTATVNSITYESNQINVQIPGYGGPADTIVYAPASVSASSSFDSIIQIINQNSDIGQNFVLDYWITSNDEITNYTSGQSTIYVGASSSQNTTVTLTAPSSAGAYKLRASASYTGGPDIAFDSFEVVSDATSGTSSEGGSSGGGGGRSLTGKATEEIVCNPPYMRYEKGCCLEANNNLICDKDEIQESNKEQKGETKEEEVIEKEKPKSTVQNIMKFIKSSYTPAILIALLVMVGSLFIFAKRKYAVYTLITSGVAVILINVPKFNLTGEVVREIVSPTNVIVGISIIGLFVMLIIIMRRIMKRGKRRDVTRLNNIRGLRVYAENGDYVGKIKEAVLENKGSNIYGWVIRPDKKMKSKIRRKNILINHKQVKSISNIMIVDEKVLERLKELESGNNYG